MDKPTDEQIKEFWEWCGFVNEITRSPSLSGFGGDDIYNWTHPDKVIYSKKLPPIDLNNLFKYAVPKVYELGFWMQWYLDSNGCDVRIHHLNSQDNYSIYQDKDPALALFWALDKIRKT